MNKMSCRVCSSQDHVLIYHGPIRSGGIGSEAIDGHEIFQCNHCGFISLHPLPSSLADFYETDEYRLQFFSETEVEAMRKKYDHEQNARISRIGVQAMRGKIIADFGAGPGLFLDAIQGIAGRTIAIEPAKIYRDHFLSRGHAHFPYVADMIAASEKVDIAVSFDTIEHVMDVHQFAGQIYESLVEGGTLYLSMPNHMDVIRLICSEAYEPFFYQIAHLNYFNGNSARVLLESTGFKNVTVAFLHKYNINNLIHWTKNGLPGLFNAGTIFDGHFHNSYVSEIERMGLASHLFIKASKGE